MNHVARVTALGFASTSYSASGIEHLFLNSRTLSRVADFCIPVVSNDFYLVTVKGSEHAAFTGPNDRTVRKVAVDNTKSSLEKSLQAIKTQLEQQT
jgi:hypothetical protein